MAKQDRSGTKYEKLLACSLDALGIRRNSNLGLNYLQPSKTAELAVPDTYIQPDLIVRKEDEITAVIYVTHWSNPRDSHRKFWRTFEELAQQKISAPTKFVGISCVFEALPACSSPLLCVGADELPEDSTRSKALPLQLHGWQASIGWAMCECFDVNILFPISYPGVANVSKFSEGGHDAVVTDVLRTALTRVSKSHFKTQWEVLNKLKKSAVKVSRLCLDTASRYRIGLLHLYLFRKVLEKRIEKGNVSVFDLVSTLTKVAGERIEISKLRKHPPFDQLSLVELNDLFDVLASVYVRRGKKPESFCSFRLFSVGANTLKEVAFNSDLKMCVEDLKEHLKTAGFVTAIERAFERFDRAFGVGEAISDLAFPDSVGRKVSFVEQHLLPLQTKQDELGTELWSLSKAEEPRRSAVSSHIQNWHFELLLNLCGLNTMEHIATRFKALFEESGHKLRPHAPYGGHAQTVAFMLQGRDLCELWSKDGKRRTLKPDEFRKLCWETVARCIADALLDYGGEHKQAAPDKAVIAYLQNKSMRIISSDLNGFYILIDHFLGDLCHLQFLDDNEQEDGAVDRLSARVCPSWQTDMVNGLWGSAPLETWVEGVSKDGKWLIKVQSAQDGHEADKTKELAGRCRAMHLNWKAGKDIRDRSKWTFTARTMPKCALVLDGDWDRTNKKNLYEAGWDWVGDVSQLEDLRQLIVQSAK